MKKILKDEYDDSSLDDNAGYLPLKIETIKECIKSKDQLTEEMIFGEKLKPDCEDFEISLDDFDE